MKTHVIIEQLLNEAQQEHRCVMNATTTQRHAFCRRVQDGEIVSPVPGMYARASYWNQLDIPERNRHIIRCLGAQHPLWIFGGTAAVCMHGIDHDRTADASRFLVISDVQRSQLASRHVVHRYEEDCPFVVVDNVRVVPPERAVAESMRDHGFVNAVVVASCAMHDGMSQAQIVQGLCEIGGGGDDVWHALDIADARCENGGEARVVAVTDQVGLEVPDTQREFTDPETGRRMRADFAWERENGDCIVGELDGRDKYVDPTMTGGRSVEEIVDDERERERALERAGVCRIVRFRIRETYHPAEFAKKLRDAGVPPARR